LQLAGELLRLLEQALGTHGGLDGVEHHADAAGQLLEERQVRFGEAIHGRQLDHCLDLAFVQHGQRNDVPRFAGHQPTAHLDQILGNVFQQDAAAIGSALPDQPLAQCKAPRLIHGLRIGISCQLLEGRPGGLCLHDVDHPLLRAD